jgi:hypothetical protein
LAWNTRTLIAALIGHVPIACDTFIARVFAVASKGLVKDVTFGSSVRRLDQ